jgi:rhodanese-related sulfurtransferase
MALQFAALFGLSAALGFTFNAANPIGVRFGKVATATAPATSLTNFALTSTTALAATAPSPQTAIHTAPQPVQPPIPKPPIPQLPTAGVTHVHSPTVSVPSVRPATNPAPVAVVPAVQTNLNPAPIHWREAKPLVAAGQGLLVDVRARPMYDAGHIPDAVSVPETSSSAEIAAFLKLLPTNMTLIVYCSSTSCSQSLRVANRLVAEFHHPSVKYMTGGYMEYQQEELARSQQPANPQQPADR